MLTKFVSCSKQFVVRIFKQYYHPRQVQRLKVSKFHSKMTAANVTGNLIDKTDEFILESCFPASEPPTLTSNSVVEYLLQKAKENVAAGRSKWLTNSVTGETLLYDDLDSMTRKVASFMHKKGMRKGDKALYLTSDVTRIFTIIAGVWRLGGCMYSSYPEDTEDTLLMRIVESKARWIFCDPASVPDCKSAAKRTDWKVEVIVFGDNDEFTSVDKLFEDDGTECPEEISSDLDDPILILCTSGTTGLSKGAIYTNRTVLAFCLATNGLPRNNPLPALWLIKCTHVLGVLYPMRNIFVGDWSLMLHQITKENIYKTIDKYHPFLAFGFPTYLMLLATDPEAKKYDLTSLEIVCTGGIVITSKFYETMLTLPHIKYVINGFGMTECGAITTTVDISGSVTKFRAIPNIPPLSVGKIYPNSSLKVLDLDSGKSLGPNKRGELCIKSPILSTAYWNREEENAKAFKDGWFRTGDIGYHDENGFVFIVDRVKETFKYFNNHISPSELESVILKHPDIAEASVFGMIDPEGGDRIPRAVVVLNPGAKVTSAEIVTFVDSQVASYKKLRGGVFIVPSLPRGKTGKVMRSLVAALPLS